MTDISLEGLMAGEQITGMLKDVEGEPEYVKTIRTLIRNVHEAFFGSESKSDDDKKQLLLNLIQGYKPDSLPNEEKAKYTFFDAASQQLVAFSIPLEGNKDVVSTTPSITDSKESNAVKDSVSEQSTTDSEQVSSTVQPETQEDTASDVVASSNSGSNEETGVPTNEQNSNLETTDEPIDEDLKHIQNGVQTDLQENNQPSIK